MNNLEQIQVVLAQTGMEEELASMRDRCMKDSLMAVGRYDPVRVRQRLLSDYDAHETHLILNPDGLLLGFFCLRKTDEGWYLRHLYVDLPYQGKGLGALVLRWIGTNIRLTTLSLNTLKGSPAKDFYLKQGFHITSTDEWDHYLTKNYKDQERNWEVSNDKSRD